MLLRVVIPNRCYRELTPSGGHRRWVRIERNELLYHVGTVIRPASPLDPDPRCFSTVYVSSVGIVFRMGRTLLDDVSDGNLVELA